jgi:hypothetical protein
MKIGRPDGWWNRKIPIARIGLIAAALFLGFYIWAAYGDLIGTVLWDIRHQRTASFRGQTLRLPWLWREEEWTNYNEFNLKQSRGRLVLPASVTVTYEGATPGDMEKMCLSMKSHLVNPPSSVPGWLNPSTRATISTGHDMSVFRTVLIGPQFWRWNAFHAMGDGW